MTSDIDEASKENFVSAMNDDFNTSKALSVLFDLAGKTNTAVDNSNKNEAILWASSMVNLGNVLGLDLKKAELDESLLEDKLAQIKDKLDFISEEDKTLSAKEIITKVIEYRKKVREEKNYQESDRIRDILSSVGLQLKDTKDGCIYSL